MTSPADVYPKKPLGKNDIGRNKFFVFFFFAKYVELLHSLPGITDLIYIKVRNSAEKRSIVTSRIDELRGKLRRHEIMPVWHNYGGIGIGAVSFLVTRGCGCRGESM